MEESPDFTLVLLEIHWSMLGREHNFIYIYMFVKLNVDIVRMVYKRARVESEIPIKKADIATEIMIDWSNGGDKKGSDSEHILIKLSDGFKVLCEDKGESKGDPMLCHLQKWEEFSAEKPWRKIRSSVWTMLCFRCKLVFKCRCRCQRGNTEKREKIRKKNL